MDVKAIEDVDLFSTNATSELTQLALNITEQSRLNLYLNGEEALVRETLLERIKNFTGIIAVPNMTIEATQHFSKLVQLASDSSVPQTDSAFEHANQIVNIIFDGIMSSQWIDAAQNETVLNSSSTRDVEDIIRSAASALSNVIDKTPNSDPCIRLRNAESNIKLAPSAMETAKSARLGIPTDFTVRTKVFTFSSNSTKNHVKGNVHFLNGQNICSHRTLSFCA